MTQGSGNTNDESAIGRARFMLDNPGCHHSPSAFRKLIVGLLEVIYANGIAVKPDTRTDEELSAEWNLPE